MKQFAILALFILLFSAIASAQEVSADSFDDPTIFGLEIEKLLNLGSGILALGLFFTTYAAYKRKKNSRFAFVCMAFFLFAVKGFLTSLDLIGLDLGWVDPVASLLNFAIILSFFFGVIRK
jgi:hypothetical protein